MRYIIIIILFMQYVACSATDIQVTQDVIKKNQAKIQEKIEYITNGCWKLCQTNKWLGITFGYGQFLEGCEMMNLFWKQKDAQAIVANIGKKQEDCDFLTHAIRELKKGEKKYPKLDQDSMIEKVLSPIPCRGKTRSQLKQAGLKDPDFKYCMACFLMTVALYKGVYC